MSRILVLGLIVSAVAAVGVTLWHLRGERQTFYTDADTIRQPVDQARIRDVLWKPAVRLPEVINSASDEYEPRQTADGLSLLFVRGRAGANADLYVSDRTAQGWTTPRPLDDLNTEADELGPEPSPDGSTIYFYSDRAGGSGGYDLWMSRREGDRWSTPVNLGPDVNSPYHDYGPAVTPDGAGLYFSSNRPRVQAGLTTTEPADTPSPLTVRDDMEHRDYDLYLAVVGPEGVGQTQPLTALNSESNDVAPAVSPGGDFLYFCSDRDGGQGGFDILRSRRLRGAHRPAANLGDSLNTAADELDPAVAMGGFGLYFTSDRSEAGEADDLDLYFAASREVFAETEVQPASIDWSAIWSAIWPLLLWMLLIALLWLALSKLGDRKTLGRLSLLAKCLLASMLVHALLMLVLTAVQVSTSLSELIRDRSGTRVALVSPSASAAGDLAAQIRGSLTDVEIQVSQDASAQRQEQAVEPEPSSAMATLTVQRSTIEARPEPPQPAAADDAPAPATTPIVQTPTTEQQPSPVRVTLPAPAQPMRTAEAQASSPAQTAQAARAPSESQQMARESATSSSSSVELAVQPADLASDARLNQRLHDAGQMPDAETSPETAMADAAPATPVTSTVAALDLSIPSTSDASTERVTEAQVTVAAQASPAIRQRASAARRAASSSQVNVSPQPLDRPLAQGSMAVADIRPAAATASETTDDHRRGLTSLIVQPSPAPSMQTMPEAAAAPAGEPVPDAATVASASASRQSPSATTSSDVSTVSLEVVSSASPADLAGRSLSSARADDSPSPTRRSGRSAAAATSTRVGQPVTELALDLPGSTERPPANAGAEVSSVSGPSTAQHAERAAVARTTPRSAVADPRVDLAPVDRTASRAETKSLAADLPAASDAEPSTSASAGPRRPMVAVDARSGALDLALPSGSPQMDEPRSEPPRGLASATVDTRRTRAASATDLPSSVGMRRVDVSPTTSAPPALDRLVAAARVVSSDGAARKGGAGFEAGGVELTLASSLVTELPELEESVASGPGERGRAMPPAHVETRRSSLARGDLGGDGPSRQLVPPEVFEPEMIDPTEQRLMATAAADPHLDVVDVLARPELIRPPVVQPTVAALDLSLPRQVAPKPTPFEHRAPERRKELVDRGGGGEDTEQAVALALQWLARHQDKNGRWNSRRFDRDCGGCEGPARVDCDIALTGLSVLCFLAADHSPAAPGPYRDVVARGVEYLLKRQGRSGEMLGDESMYSHGIATIALAEAYGMTKDPTLVQPVRLAVNFIYEARNRRLGGWRYDPGQVGDTSVLGWQVMAIKSAQRSGLAVPTAAYDVAEKWLQRVKDPWKPGLYSYQPKRRVTHPMTAEAMFVRQLLGTPATDPTMGNAADYLLTYMPDWDQGPNTYYWYYATLALYQHGGVHWDRWNEAMKTQLLEHQHQSGLTAGSWDPEGKWANVGGRIYQTTLATLTLQVYYRYLPLYLEEQ